MNELEIARAVDRYRAGEISPEEERSILADPALRAAFVSHVRLGVRLETAHRDPEDPSLAERTKALMRAKEPGQAVRTVGEIRRRVERRAKTRGWIVRAVAAASVLVAALAALTARPARSPAPQRPREIVRSEPEKPSLPAPVEEAPPPAAPPGKPPAPLPVPPLPKEPGSFVRPPVPEPEAPPAPAPPPEPPRPAPETKVAAARIESVAGEALLAGGRDAVRPGQDLLPGQGVRTRGASSGAVILFADGTRVELGPESLLQAVFDHDRAGGKRLLLDRGRLRAQVARQPDGRPLELRTPHAEAHVLGTTLRLLARDASTRLEVVEGKVRIRRTGQATAVDVGAGEYAVATPDADPVAYPEPVFIDLDEFGTGREAKPADGPVRRLYRDVSLRSTGGTCVAAPGVGTSLDGVLPLSPGAWHLWIRYRDTDLGPVSFRVEIDGRTAATVVGEGKAPVEKWNWRRVPFEAKGKAVRLTLRSTSEALKWDKGDKTFAVVNRWDSIVLTRDPDVDPEKGP